MKQLQKNIIFLAFMATLAVTGSLFVGCGGDDNNLLLAEVGPDKIQAINLNEIFERQTQPFDSFEDELTFRRSILDSLIVQQLLIQEAYRLGLDASEEVNRLVLNNKNEFLLDVLYLREIEDHISFDEQEVRALYDSLEYKVMSSHILFEDEETALIIFDSLNSGADFGEMAINHSIDPLVKQNRGELDYAVWGQLVMPFSEAIFNLAPGEISRPFKTNFGWHIAKVEDRIPNDERKSFELMQEFLEESVKNSYRGQLMDSFLTVIENKSPITIEEATIEYVIHKRDNLYPQQLLESMPKNDFDLRQLDRHEKELILATWEGGQMTLGQYLTMIKQQRAEVRPDLDDYEKMEKFIFLQNVMDLLAAEARRKGIEDDPEYKRKIKRFRELTMAVIVENDSIPIINPVTDEELKQYYDDNIELFEIPAKIHIYEILLSSEQEAIKYKNEIKSLTKFREVASKVTERPNYREREGDMNYIEQRTNELIYNAADQVSVGQIAGPVRRNDKFAIVYVADKKPAEIQEYQQAKQSIQANMGAERKQSALASWVEAKKQETTIKIYENNLRPGINKAKYEQTN